MSLSSRSFRLLALIATALVAALTGGQSALSQDERVPVEGRHLEKKFIVKLETTQHQQYCQANVSIEYFQSDDIANVTGEIMNDDCAASSGEFTINVRIKNTESDLVDFNFDETWQREDDRSVLFSRAYTIGRNVDLIRVRTRKLKCVCAGDQGADDIPDRNQE